MKHILNLSFFLLLTLGTALNVKATPIVVTYNGIHYEIVYTDSGAEAWVVGHSDDFSGVANIPSSVVYQGFVPVTTIGSAFQDCTSLTGVTIPNSVTGIGNHAFDGCTSLTSVTIPNSVIVIGENAFEGCSSLTSVTIPNSVIYLGKEAFWNCTSLTSVTIPNSITTIYKHTFGGCCSLTSVTIPNSVTSIGDGAFSGCGLTSVTIPNSVTSIGDRAFSGCGLTSVTVPNSVTKISDKCFQNCTSLTSATIPNSVTIIGEYAFGGCSSLTSVTIPNSVTSIGLAAFYYCTNLNSVAIGNSVSSIGDYAFYECTSLTSIDIPNSVTSIEEYAFSECTSMTSIVIPNSVTTIGLGAFSFCTGLTSASIGNSVTSIFKGVFYSCTNLTSVTIGNSVTTIGEYAFAGCGMTSVIIPNSVTYIGLGAFWHCTFLTSVDIGNSVNTIGEYAFSECTSLTSIDIPNSVTDIDMAAFSWCTGLRSVTIGNSVTSIGLGAFYECTSLTNLIVRSGNTVYDSRNNCNAIIETASNTLIYGCLNTTIPNSVTTIGLSAFLDCSGLTSIHIPNSITTIEGGAFSGCGLTSVTIPNSVTDIGEGAFSYCTSLNSVTIGNSVTSIGECAFYECTSLTSVTCLDETPPTAYSNTFSNYSATLYVSAGSLNAYKTTEPWSNFYNIQPIGQEYSLSLDQTSAVMEKGDVIHLKATVTPDDDNAPQVTWSSSNASVATVDEWGFVTAVGTGNAVITARAGDASATCSVKVVAHTVTLDKSSASIPLYSTLQLNATVTPHDGYEPTVEWSSSHPGVAAVTQDGLVKGYMTGTATITAKAGQSTATCVVTVTPIQATSLMLNVYEYEIGVGDVFRLVATVYPDNATNRNVSWTVPQNDVISYSLSGNECLIVGEKAGQVTITARTTDGTNLSKSCVVTVRGSEPVFIPVQSVSVVPSNLRMTVGATRKLRAIVLPSNASNSAVRWVSSNTSVVTVTPDGQIKALKTGTATVTAHSTDGTGKSGSCEVTVVPSSGEDTLLGDVNGDGLVNITDVIALIDYLLTDDSTGIDMVAADFNEDGMVNVSDVTALIDHLLNGD